ncbi:hypothetical protein Maq22A_c26410 [Methylobacterium aquaticum]|uniref:Uncharacterized protein n=1 Tax=Methylobacterium aquaticum TaxID=270351 RepID=A0A0C6FLX4_9HYPH|nr:hypothetical protein Maq22A_c26410 [Methylobacterium aquaticum]
MNLTISPTGRGRYDARLGDRLLCTSETPFLAAARILKAEGVKRHRNGTPDRRPIGPPC